MPIGVNEQVWERAKRRVRKEYPKLSEESPTFWKIVQKIYRSMVSHERPGGKAKRDGKPMVKSGTKPLLPSSGSQIQAPPGVVIDMP